MIHAAVILIVAFILDLLLGDPPFRFHPIRLMGAAIAALENVLLRLTLSGLVGGTLLASGLICLSVAAYATARFFLTLLNPWLASALDLYLVYSSLALTDLIRHALPVATALDNSDPPQARAILQNIVGRDTVYLDESGVARGAVESVAENFVDGVLAPICWYSAGAILCSVLRFKDPTLGGVCFILSFKAVNTLDSMVGYRHSHYALFGRPSALLDDLANLIPARLSLVIFFLGAHLSAEDAQAGWKIGWRDRLQHTSPNAGHPESFVAGALGIRLGGPSVYKETMVDKPWLGDGDGEVGPNHIRRCCRLVHRSSWVAVLFFAALLLLFSVFLR
jgi:adenosylcobinamide-phosphate synthase